MRKKMAIIATLPPYVDHRFRIIAHPRVSELRFNSISPLGGSELDLLERLQDECGDKPLWVDLKGRQLRITKFAYLPYAFVELSHRIEVDLPCDIHFKDCTAEIVDIVDGNKLILNDRPVRVVGEGEPVNIVDPSLRIHGSLTDRDLRYIEAAQSLGIHRYMLSFAERVADPDELRSLDDKASIILKIESRKGLGYVRRRSYPGFGNRLRLMAARDDLFVQLKRDPHAYLKGLEQIVKSDPNAVAASRILTSLEDSRHPSAADIADLELLIRMGYRNFMLSDMLCFIEGGTPFRRAMQVFEACAYRKRGE